MKNCIGDTVTVNDIICTGRNAITYEVIQFLLYIAIHQIRECQKINQVNNEKVV